MLAGRELEAYLAGFALKGYKKSWYVVRHRDHAPVARPFAKQEKALDAIPGIKQNEARVVVQFSREQMTSVASRRCWRIKQYAAEFCGTKDLRQASREQVASFIKHIAEFAARDKEELLVKLKSRSAGRCRIALGILASPAPTLNVVDLEPRNRPAVLTWSPRGSSADAVA
jgi:hypothetical protein